MSTQPGPHGLTPTPAPLAAAAVTVNIEGVTLTLTHPDRFVSEWIDYYDYQRQLAAAWLRLSDKEPPLNPRLIGESGLGKTTLACAAGRALGLDVYFFQCTMDTRPEDLLITPVLTGDKRVEYRATSLVSAMVKGGVLILDEGNRMPERAWASLAPLMDERRYIESAITSLKIHAHPDFRLCVTMNDDTSVFELPTYIQCRLKPRIEVVKPPDAIQERILRAKCPGVDDAILRDVFALIKARSKEIGDSVRDVLSLAQYAQKLKAQGFETPLKTAAAQVLTKPEVGSDVAK